MPTNYLFETIYTTFNNELSKNYEAQACEAVDTITSGKLYFSKMVMEPDDYNEVEVRTQFKELFNTVNSVSPIPETIKAVAVFIKSLEASEVAQ